jgi:PAS domain S-box-containing protein/diguanylate cyclase (GGDEF)-like protein
MSDLQAPRTASAVAIEVLTTAFERAPVGVGVCDEDGRFVAVNESLATLLERPTNALVGRPFLTFVHPDERAASLACYFASVVAAAGDKPQNPAHGQLRCVTGSGGVVWLSASWTITAPDRNGHQYGVVHLRDVTEQHEFRQQLAEAQRRFELAFNCAPIGIAMVGAEGQFLQTNRALQVMLGYTEAELLERTFSEVSHPAERAASVAVFHQLLVGEIDVHESVKSYLHRDGHTVHARRVAAAARRPDGQADYLLVQIEDITAERHATDRLTELQVRDRITGLATAASLSLHLELSQAPRSLVLLQIEDLPRLTSALGHAEANQLLRQLANRLAACSRDGDVLARVSDSEFAVVLEDASGDAGASLAARLSGDLAQPIITDHAATTVSVRIGLDADPEGTRPLNALLQRAGLAAQSPDESQPRTWARFKPAMLTSSARELALEADLRRALDDHELHLAYQPIIAVADGRIAAVEALSRWNHPALGPIPAGEFIAIAERSTSMSTLTRWALTTACTDLARWQSDLASADELAVAVNISALTFANPDFPSLVDECLNRAEVSAERLILEITETAAANADQSFVHNANRLRERGIRIALDDFGAGYSSLTRLARLPITELKLDRALTDPELNPNVARALLSATIDLATDLGLTLVAEGIETREQLDLLRTSGCPYAQGHLLAVPQSADEVWRLLHRAGPPGAEVSDA